jgi:hypothetical protein
MARAIPDGWITGLTDSSYGNLPMSKRKNLPAARD